MVHLRNLDYVFCQHPVGAGNEYLHGILTFLRWYYALYIIV